MTNNGLPHDTLYIYVRGRNLSTLSLEINNKQKLNFLFIKHIFLLLAFIFLPVTASAQYGGQTGELTWSFSNGTFTISGTGAIPDYGYGEAPWHAHYENITTVVIGDGITAIGSHVFYNCSNLESVTIPAGVTAIGYNAFGNCDNLTSIGVADENIYYESVDGILFNEAQTALVQYPAGKAGASYEIPDGVTTICAWAFNACNLESVTIPAGVTAIGNYAFVNTFSLADVTVGWTETPPATDDYTFYGNQASATLHVPYGTPGIYAAEDGWKEFGTIEEMPRGGYDGTETLPSGVLYVSCGEGILTVDTPAAEQIAVYSMNGALLYQAQKGIGEAVYRPGRLPKGILIVKGSSGWVKKFAAK
jgi:hypothetical protein